VARGLGLISLIVTLAAVGVLLSSQLGGQSAPTQPQQNRAVAEANAAAAGLTAAQAERQLVAYQAEHATYAGAALTGLSGVTILRADASSFCLQLTTTSGVLYDAGPGGTPTTQHC
jgi:hypothetical protein